EGVAGAARQDAHLPLVQRHPGPVLLRRIVVPSLRNGPVGGRAGRRGFEDVGEIRHARASRNDGPSIPRRAARVKAARPAQPSGWLNAQTTPYGSRTWP